MCRPLPRSKQYCGARADHRAGEPASATSEENVSAETERLWADRGLLLKVDDAFYKLDGAGVRLSPRNTPRRDAWSAGWW